MVVRAGHQTIGTWHSAGRGNGPGTSSDGDGVADSTAVGDRVALADSDVELDSVGVVECDTPSGQVAVGVAECDLDWEADLVSVAL